MTLASIYSQGNFPSSFGTGSNPKPTVLYRSFDGKAKIWSIETKACVATHSESDKTLWSVKWLPKTHRAEMFAVAGAGKSISFYREASGS